MLMMVGDRLVAHDRLRIAVRRCMGMLYADDSLVGSRDLDWLQGYLNVIIGLFRHYKLVANVANSKAMMYQTE